MRPNPVGRGRDSISEIEPVQAEIGRLVFGGEVATMFGSTRPEAARQYFPNLSLKGLLGSETCRIVNSHNCQNGHWLLATHAARIDSLAAIDLRYRVGSSFPYRGIHTSDLGRRHVSRLI